MKRIVQPAPARTGTPINVCPDCGCNSSNGHICRGRTVRRTTGSSR